jgi:hypothetical protein
VPRQSAERPHLTVAQLFDKLAAAGVTITVNNRSTD